MAEQSKEYPLIFIGKPGMNQMLWDEEATKKPAELRE